MRAGTSAPLLALLTIAARPSVLASTSGGTCAGGWNRGAVPTTTTVDECQITRRLVSGSTPWRVVSAGGLCIQGLFGAPVSPVAREDHRFHRGRVH
jgi:hypothetical protein